MIQERPEWYGGQNGQVSVPEREMRVRKPRLLRRREKGEGGDVGVSAYGAMQQKPGQSCGSPRLNPGGAALWSAGGTCILDTAGPPRCILEHMSGLIYVSTILILF